MENDGRERDVGCTARETNLSQLSRVGGNESWFKSFQRKDGADISDTRRQCC